ncbi:CobW family GTP-binding protein [Agaribacterium haliotis]|uniref:CobW family GTP-binding protein n=1 Tax=Agaribacterium haliotis TaxID=2013869 RepID=UPI000BB57BAE|nr:GTP-binding protein [Agaribacterium haliotis]
MKAHTTAIHAVPTNIITGFLGVGKTSAILHLLKNKAADERWAVLVNEFGEIGVDGSLFAGQHPESEEVFIREVPGGCMCCAAGLPMQIALNQLLSRAKPDRLLIEPTGLGHPKEVLEVLSSEHYRDVLSLQKILTLVDARKLADARYREHSTFQQQIAIADVLVANKQDLYSGNEQLLLEDYARQYARPEVALVFSQNGQFAPQLLDGATSASIATASSSHHHSGHTANKELVADLPMPDSGFLKACNKGEGFISSGWRISPQHVFSYDKLFAFLSGLHAERMKAVFITEQGVFAYNLSSDALTEMELDDCLESRIEIIADREDASWQEQLMACLNEDYT